MQVLIKIPDEEYKKISNSNPSYADDFSIYYAIKNGIPLPKGHGRLIDADEAIQRLCGKSCGCTLEECGYEVPCFSVQRINSAQIIIEADKEQEE